MGTRGGSRATRSGTWVARGGSGGGYPAQRVLGERGKKVVLTGPNGQGEQVVSNATMRRHYGTVSVHGEFVPPSIYIQKPATQRWVKAPDGRVGIITGSGRNGVGVQFLHGNANKTTTSTASFKRSELKRISAPKGKGMYNKKQR